MPDRPPQLDESPIAVDPTLVDLLATLSPEERLRWNDRMARTVLELRDAFAAVRPDDPPRTPRGERG